MRGGGEEDLDIGSLKIGTAPITSRSFKLTDKGEKKKSLQFLLA